MKRLWVLLAISSVVVVLIGIVLNRTAQAPEPTSERSAAHSATVTEPDVLYVGSPNAPVRIVEYADFKCPKCNEFQQNAGKDIRKNYLDTGLARLEFRPYPVFGEDAGLALYASYCAQEQGMFEGYYHGMYQYMWENHYKNGTYEAAARQILTPQVITDVAVKAGAKREAFTSCVEGKTHAEAYYAAIDKAAKDTIQGTPTFIIRGEKIVGPQPYAIFRTLLEIPAR